MTLLELDTLRAFEPGRSMPGLELAPPAGEPEGEGERESRKLRLLGGGWEAVCRATDDETCDMGMPIRSACNEYLVKKEPLM